MDTDLQVNVNQNDEQCVLQNENHVERVEL